MSNDEIINTPKLNDLQREAEQFRAFRKVWPLLKPLAKLLGADTKAIDESLDKGVDLAN